MKKIRNNHSSLSTTLLVYHRGFRMARIYCGFTQEKKTKGASKWDSDCKRFLIKRASNETLAINRV